MAPLGRHRPSFLRAQSRLLSSCFLLFFCSKRPFLRFWRFEHSVNYCIYLQEEEAQQVCNFILEKILETSFFSGKIISISHKFTKIYAKNMMFLKTNVRQKTLNVHKCPWLKGKSSGSFDGAVWGDDLLLRRSNFIFNGASYKIDCFFFSNDSETHFR